MIQKSTHISNGDYLRPNIKLSYAKPLKRNRFTQMAETHLKESNPILYNDMILGEKLFPYLKDIGETADRRMDQLMMEPLKRILHRKKLQIK